MNHIGAWSDSLFKSASRSEPVPIADPRHISGRLSDIHRLTPRRRTVNEAVIRSLCSNAYLGDYTSLCRVLGRYRMFVDPRDVGLRSHLLTEGYWESWHAEAMVATVRPGMKVVDAGANLGYFTLPLADLVGPTGQVHAFEPNPEMVRRLRNSVEINGFGPRTTIHPLGLSDADGSAALVASDHDPKNGQVVASGTAADATAIAIRRLDAIAGLHDIDFIKIDVEGGEEALWSGMAGIIAGNRPLTMFLDFTADRYADARGFIDRLLARDDRRRPRHYSNRHRDAARQARQRGPARRAAALASRLISGARARPAPGLSRR